jgi:uncharacterized cupredoxin-like copper-binding protein
MGDTMRFSPADITVKQGETVRFVIENKGKLEHEMVLGTKEVLKQHAAHMRQHPDMAHDEPQMAHLAPGQRGGPLRGRDDRQDQCHQVSPV